MSRTVLVLAATGTTGTQTVLALLEAGATVRAATRDPASHSFPAGVEAVAFSWDDRSTWGAALAGVDAVYLAMPGFRPDEVAESNALVAAAKEAGATRIVKLSAAGVENMPASGHRQQELGIEASGLDWVHLRPTFFMENFAGMYGGAIVAEGAIYLPAGQGRTSFIAAADIGAAAAKALLGETRGEAWVLTGPQSMDHGEVAAAITAAAGYPVQYVDVPPDAWAAGLREHGVPDKGVAILTGLYDAVRAGYTADISPDAERVLGRSPTTFADWAKGKAGAWSR